MRPAPRMGIGMAHRVARPSFRTGRADFPRPALRLRILSLRFLRRSSTACAQGGGPQPKALGRSMRRLRSFRSSVQPRRLLRLFRRPFHGGTSRKNIIRICVSCLGGTIHTLTGTRQTGRAVGDGVRTSAARRHRHQGTAAERRGSGASYCGSPAPSGWPSDSPFPFTFPYPHTLSPSRTSLPRVREREPLAPPRKTLPATRRRHAG